MCEDLPSRGIQGANHPCHDIERGHRSMHFQGISVLFADILFPFSLYLGINFPGAAEIRTHMRLQVVLINGCLCPLREMEGDETQTRMRI
jgi:hypothetical protein